MCLLPKIHKRLSDVPGRPVISNCGTPTEKASEFLGNQLKEVMQNGWSYIKDSNDFMKKIKHLKNIPDNAILVTEYDVGLYPSIPHEAGLRALKKILGRREEKKISTEDLVKMAEFVLKKTTLSSTVRLNIKYRVRLSALNLHLHMHASSWMR